MSIRYNVDDLRIDLRNYLKANGITIRGFGKLAQTSPSIISRILTGDYNPGITIMNRIYDVIGYPEIYKPEDKYELWSIDHLDEFINQLITIRNHKAKIEYESKIKDLREQLNTYETLLKEIEVEET